MWSWSWTRIVPKDVPIQLKLFLARPWQLVLRQERHLALLNNERVPPQIDAALMPLEHVEPEEEVHVSTLRVVGRPDISPTCPVSSVWQGRRQVSTHFEDRKAALKEEVRHLELRAVHPPENLARAYSARHPGKARVDQAHDAAAFSARGRH